MEYLLNQTSFRLKSGKTVTSAELSDIISLAEEQEKRIVYIEGLIDQGTQLDGIPLEKLSQWLNQFCRFIDDDDFYREEEEVFSATEIDQYHHKQAHQIVAEVCWNYIQEHQLES